MTLAIIILGLVLGVSIAINVALLNRLLAQANIPVLRPVPVGLTKPGEPEKPARKPLFSIPVQD